MLTRRRLGALAVALALAAGAALRAEAPAPTLTDLQRLTLQNRVLAFQLAQAQLEATITALAVPGYALDLQRIVYVKTAAPAAGPAEGPR